VVIVRVAVGSFGGHLGDGGAGGFLVYDGLFSAKAAVSAWTARLFTARG
jgi:hypothetical protein